MEIPAWLFFSFWAVISITFLHLGFYALDKTELSSSVSPVVMSVFKHSLAISSCCSSCSPLMLRPCSTDLILKLHFWVAYAILIVLYLKFRTITGKTLLLLAFTIFFFVWLFDFSPKLKILVRGFFAWLLDFLSKFMIFADSFFSWLLYFLSSKRLWGFLLCILTTPVLFIPTDSVLWAIPAMALINFIGIVSSDIGFIPEKRILIGIHMSIEASLFFINNETTKFFPILVLFLSISIPMIWTALSPLESYTLVSGDESSTESMPLATKLKVILSGLKEKKTLLKLVAFAVGMLGTLLFQYFFKLTSFNHVVAFLSLAVTWLANLALLGVSSDFGIFNFLLGNVVVGCTVNQFGLQRTTWLAYGASLLLFGLRLKLDSSNLVHTGEAQHIQVMLSSQSSPSLLPT